MNFALESSDPSSGSSRILPQRVLRWRPKRMVQVHEQAKLPASLKPNNILNSKSLASQRKLMSHKGLAQSSAKVSPSRPGAAVDCTKPVPLPTQLTGRLECNKCLGLGHTWKECKNLVRCKICFNYGHHSNACLSRFRLKRRYRVLSRSEDQGPPDSNLYRASLEASISISAPPHPSQPTTTVNPSSASPMAN